MNRLQYWLELYVKLKQEGDMRRFLCIIFGHLDVEHRLRAGHKHCNFCYSCLV